MYGTFRRIKWAVLFVTLGIYYGLPFLRWDRGIYAPHQAVLVDLAQPPVLFLLHRALAAGDLLPHRPLILAALTLFLMNAVAGASGAAISARRRCGPTFSKPSNAGSRATGASICGAMPGRGRSIALARLGLKHFLWLMVAWWTGGAWVLYFADAPTLVKDLATLAAPLIAYIWIGILTVTTYSFAGLMREQVCLYMCPWPRIQAALTDEYALNVTYRYDRGEPRASLKKAATACAVAG